MGMQVLPPLPDRFLDDARAGYHAPQEAGHQNVIMLKQYTVVSIDMLTTWGLQYLLLRLCGFGGAAVDAVPRLSSTAKLLEHEQ